MAETVQPKTEESVITLKEFIDDHQKMIAVAGVFVALGLFWKTDYAGGSLPYLSYLCFLITIPLFIEISKNYSFEKASWNLTIFHQIFGGILFFSLLRVLFHNIEHTVSIGIGLLYFGLSTWGSYLTERFYNRLNRKDYEWGLGQNEKIGEMGFDAEKRNELVESVNVLLRKFYKRNRQVKFAAEVLVFVIPMAVIVWLYEPSKAFVYWIEDRPVVEIPMIASN